MVLRKCASDAATNGTHNAYKHDHNAEPLAAYAEDTLAKIRGVRVLIADALRHREHPTHMNVREALDLAARVQPQQTWLTHLTHRTAHSELEKELPRGIAPAFDGLTVRID